MREGLIRVDEIIFKVEMKKDLRRFIYTGGLMMPKSWIQAVLAYSYPVKLSSFQKSNEFPGYFRLNIQGGRSSTMKFEKYFQDNAALNIEVWFEVIYWKLYSQPNRRQNATDRIIGAVQRNGTTSPQLYNAVQQFINDPNKTSLKLIRRLLGLSSNVLAVALTLPALLSPGSLPMVDNQVAKWVNQNGAAYSRNTVNKLTDFNMKATSLQDDDFPNYLAWVYWCREMADLLTQHTGLPWRPRDVEMAVFTSQRAGIKVNVL